MNILVYPHMLTVGGSQLNAIELAGAVRDLGHDVTVFGTPGPLVDVVHDMGLPFVESPEPHWRPTPAIVGALRAVVAERSIDVLHGYEWPPALECFVAGDLLLSTPSVCTVMSMGVAPFIPAQMPLVVGTRHIRDAVRSQRSGAVTVIEPPVDTTTNRPGMDVGPFRQQHGLVDGDLHVVVVSRLARELKLRGLLEAIDVVSGLARHLPVRLIVAGDGPARGEVTAAARAVNEVTGKETILLTGELLDPRPAYAVADVALGMGGSALRAMAFGQPLIVQGEDGFWEELNPSTVTQFLHSGWYGRGDGGSGADRLRSLLQRLLNDADRRRHLGGYGRQLVLDRFSLRSAAQVQADVYQQAVTAGVRRSSLLLDSWRSAKSLLVHDVHRRWERRKGCVVLDDFNAIASQSRSPEPVVPCAMRDARLPPLVAADVTPIASASGDGRPERTVRS